MASNAARPNAINWLSFALLVMGGIIFHLSLYSLATNTPLPPANFTIVLFVGVSLIAISVTLFNANLLSNPASTRSDNFYVLYVIVLSLVFSFTRLTRFAGVSGFDAVREAEISLGTFNANYWQPSYNILTPYQSSIAITILPSMLGRILGVPSNTTLLFQTFLMMALLPIAVQAVTSVLTGSPRLGALSGVLIATNWFFFGAHLIGKTEMALFLATISIYCLMRREGSIRSLGVMLGLGVVLSHYTIGLYYSAVIILILGWIKFAGPIVKHFPGFKKMVIPPFHTWRPIVAIGLVLLWLSIAAVTVLPQLETAAVQAISGLLTNSGSKGQSAGLAFTNTAVTFWFDFQNGLLVAGALLAINYYRRGRILGNLATWTVAGVLLIVFPIAWIVIPALSVQVEATRIIGMILPFSILLVSRLFMRVYAFPGSLWKAAVIVVTLLLVPMNLMLVNPQEVLYTEPTSLIFPDKQLDLESSYLAMPSNHAMAYWVNSYVITSNPIESDSVSHYALGTALPFPSHIVSIQEDTPPSSFNRYVTVSYYFTNYDLWTKSALGTVIHPYPCSTVHCSSQFFQFCQQPLNGCQGSTRDVVYSSGRFWVISPPHNSTGY